MKDIAGQSIGVPGLYSWASATARATLRQVSPGAEPNFVATRYQDAVPLVVEFKKSVVGITRSKKLADDYVKQGKVRLVHSTQALPLNAIVASPKVTAAQVSEMRAAIATLTQSKAFEALGFKGLRYSVDEHQRLRTFYLGK